MMSQKKKKDLRESLKAEKRKIKMFLSPLPPECGWNQKKRKLPFDVKIYTIESLGAFYCQLAATC